jgi:hypothetical protein
MGGAAIAQPAEHALPEGDDLGAYSSVRRQWLAALRRQASGPRGSMAALIVLELRRDGGFVDDGPYLLDAFVVKLIEYVFGE